MAPPDLSVRVARIRSLMVSGAWDPSLIPGLAAEWGIEENTVRRASAEASRQVRSTFDPEQARARALGCLDHAAAEARRDDSPARSVNALGKVGDPMATAADLLRAPPPARPSAPVAHGAHTRK